jgi:branched-chain amino acid transport system substrate-binding protein
LSKKLTYVFALLMSALLLAACGGTPSTDDPSEPAGDDASEPMTDESAAAGAGCPEGAYKIAYQGPITGDYAALGENMLNGINLAVDQAVEAGELGEGVDLSVAEFDSQGDPAQAPPLANQAAADTEVVAMVGPAFSGESQASGPVYEEAGLPFITPSATTPGLSENGWTYFFRTVGSDKDQGPVAAAFIAEELGATKVAIMDDSSDYGKPLADFVETTLEEEFDAEIVAREGVEAGQQDYSAAVGAVAQSGAEAIFFGGYYAEAGLIKKQLADAGAGDIPFVSDDGTFDGAFFDTAGAETSANSYVTYPGIDVTSADPAFVDAYNEAFDTEPGAFSVESYQNARIIIEGLKSGACDREALREFVANFDAEVAGKQISFGENGDIEAGPFTVYKAEGGEWVVEAENLTPPGAGG